jgi:geranylgeranyl transferase type-2 subunit beta
MATFFKDKHVQFILNLDKKTSEFEYHLMAHLRLSGIYWGTTAMALMNKLDKLDRQQVIEDVMKCYHSNGGFGGHPDHDPHILFTLSAIQVLITFDSLSSVDTTQIMNCNKSFNTDIKNLQNEDGSFAGDSYGETDTRFSYCAISVASLLGKLDQIDCKKAIEYVVKCQNFDGGFGSVIGAESHSGQSSAILTEFFAALAY